MTIIDLDPFTVVKWRMTEVCNMSCSYCIHRIHISKADLDVDRILKEAQWISHIKTDRPVKIDMIGGEVTLLPLKDIYNTLKGKVDRINITSNATKPASFYNELNKIIPTTVTLSFHEEFISLEDYRKVAENMNVTNLTLEMVSTSKNQERVREFIDTFSSKYNIMVEVDKTDRDNSVLLHTDTKKNPRLSYDGKIYTSRSEFLSEVGNGRNVPSKGMICDRTHWVYICNGLARVPVNKDGHCIEYKSIDEININDCFKKVICPKDRCSICGHLSLLTP